MPEESIWHAISIRKSCNECCTTIVRKDHTHYVHSTAFMPLIGKELDWLWTLSPIKVQKIVVKR